MKEINRRDYILKLIIEEFIRTAEPVGSQYLLDEFNLSYSTATIRAEMQKLEEDGFLEKTHTSSGRVPSSKGYRYYIENLREEALDNEFKGALTTLFDNRSQNLDDVIAKSCEMLSELTKYTTLVLGPNSDMITLEKIQLISLPSSNVLILCTSTGHVESLNFNLTENVDPKDLEVCLDILSERLKGTNINELSEKAYLLKPLLSERIKTHEIIFNAFLDAFKRFSAEKMSVYGRENILDQKEFTADITKLKKIVNLLNSDEVWRKLSNREGLIVKIGSEMLVIELDDASVVSSTIEIGNETRTIALIGPKRMDYDKAIEAMKYIQNKLNEKKG
ncbi:MAG: heat-inducible transcriptional repressor HrcA [Bacillales bacterium]|jgi:heat-inducible transcriptional repressor|nr:heat-inducible transcriptional repressor HrcA [Bacillales bacterium]